LRLARSARKHPLLHNSVRWHIARAKAWQLIAVLILVELIFAAALATCYFATYRNGRPPGVAPAGALQTWLTAVRAVLGMDSFPQQPNNPYHQVLGTIAAVLGALTPAVVLSVLVVRIFSVRPFVWRAKLNVCTMLELRSDLPRAAGRDQDGMLAIRWYKHLNGLTINDLSAEVYFAFYETSAIDGSIFFRRQQLKVLDADGQEAIRRMWPQITNPMPITLWVPLRAPLADGNIVQVQGRPVTRDVSTIFVKIQGKIGGLGIELQDEQRYRLTEDLQPGRPVSVQVDPTMPTTRWRGWERFDESATYGIFFYGKLINAAELADLTSGLVVAGRDYQRATLRGWRRGWSTCVDNTDAGAPEHYADPATGAYPPVQVLFLNLERDPAQRTEGFVLPVPPSQLIHIDRREVGYARVQVTDSIDLAPGQDLPDVVWAYVGRNDRVQLARQAIIRRTAVVRREYLDAVVGALSRHDGLLQPHTGIEVPAQVPVIPLTRVDGRPAGGPATVRPEGGPGW
jgi:hypothetical protein